MIYFIQAGDDGPIKIGYAARSVERRIAVLQAGNHRTLHIRRVVEGNRLTETWLHRHFAAHRIDREWFRPCDTMLTIDPPSAAELPPAGPRSPLPEIVARFAARHGIASDTLRKWRERGRVPYRWQWKLASEARDAGELIDPAIFNLN